MRKKLLIVYVSILLMLPSLAACTNKEEKAKDMLFTAQLEVQQFADERAEKLFKQIIAAYPETESAKTAKEELKKLEKRKKKIK